MHSLLENVVILDFKKSGNMLEELNWDLKFSALKTFEKLAVRCQFTMSFLL